MHPPQPVCTLFCCVEPGPLEEQAVRLVESLRRFGGGWANSPVLIYRTRFATSFQRRTLEAFRRLGVEVVSIRPNNGLSWHQFIRRYDAMVDAESRTDTPLVAYVDCDILFLDEPAAITPDDDADLWAAVERTANLPDASGANELYFRRVAKVLGVPFDRLPMLDIPASSVHDATQGYLCFNSGFVTVRRGTGLAQRITENCRAIVRQGGMHPKSGFHFTDQVVLPFTLLAAGHRWKLLPDTHNFHVNQWTSPLKFVDAVRDVKVLHYHGCMESHVWPQFMELMRQSDHDAAAAWLEPLGAVSDPRSGCAKLVARWLHAERVLRRRLYMASRRRAAAALVP